MDGEFLKIIAVALCALVIIGLVKAYKPEFAVFLILGCSIIILYYITDSLRVVFTYLAKLYEELDYGKTYFTILIKILAVAYITDFTVSLCKDSGESSLAGKVELAGKLIVFIISLPVFISVFQLVEKLL